MKILFVVLDGLGDKPIKELKNKTPLKAANTPNLDFLAQKGICGLLEPVFTTALPSSEQGHFALFGYNPKKYEIKRGIFTAQGAGIKLRKGDVALRGNFSTVNGKLNVIDRRAGRITETKKLISAINNIKVKGIEFIIKPAGQHRVGIVMRGKGLSSKISDGDPHYSSLGTKISKIKPLSKNKAAVFTANVLNEFLKKTHIILKNHPFNKKREKKYLFPANYILIRGASSVVKIPSFKQKYNLKACCIAGKLLYQQIGKALGMKLISVKGATGLSNTNLKAKILAANKALKKYDFVFLHIKAVDTFAEDGNFRGKKRFIERIDKKLKKMLSLKNIILVVTSDHSTCCDLKRHCKELIPVLIYNSSQPKKSNLSDFSEEECRKKGFAKIKQTALMQKVLRSTDI
jgi:2,3-bisphosphoglycerate-independent phosphoglycerate mutase